jgi:hypothetical protein
MTIDQARMKKNVVRIIGLGSGSTLPILPRRAMKCPKEAKNAPQIIATFGSFVSGLLQCKP